MPATRPATSTRASSSSRARPKASPCSRHTGFAGRVNFERQAFWQARSCVYWVPAATCAPCPGGCAWRAWRGDERGAAPTGALDRAELAACLAGWRSQGPQTWEERKQMPPRTQPPVRRRRRLARRGLSAVAPSHERSPAEAGLFRFWRQPADQAAGAEAALWVDFLCVDSLWVDFLVVPEETCSRSWRLAPKRPWPRWKGRQARPG